MNVVSSIDPETGEEEWDVFDGAIWVAGPFTSKAEAERVAARLAALRLLVKEEVWKARILHAASLSARVSELERRVQLLEDTVYSGGGFGL